MLIYDVESAGRNATAQFEPVSEDIPDDIPVALRRDKPAGLPAVSELQVVRHFTSLSRRNFSIDGQFYPLGSCTMKYNPRGAAKAATTPGFLSRHPLAPLSVSQGFLQCLYELQTYLMDVPGMARVSLTP